MEIQNDYRLVYLYYLADNEGRLKGKHKAEYERLKALYSIDKAKKESKDYLEELGYIEYKGCLGSDGEWKITDKERENPIAITQKGLDVLNKKIFKSETAKKLSKKDVIYLWLLALGLILTTVLWLLDRFLCI